MHRWRRSRSSTALSKLLWVHSQNCSQPEDYVTLCSFTDFLRVIWCYEMLWVWDASVMHMIDGASKPRSSSAASLWGSSPTILISRQSPWRSVSISNSDIPSAVIMYDDGSLVVVGDGFGIAARSSGDDRFCCATSSRGSRTWENAALPQL